MNWRPWVVGASLMSAVIVNGVLLFMETFPQPPPKDPPVVTECVGELEFADASRYRNFKAFGFDEPAAEHLKKKADKLKKDRGAEWEKMLREQAATAVRVFCPGPNSTPQYAATSVLVKVDAGERVVIKPVDLRELAVQDWYATSLADDIFTELECADPRRPDATVMGVAALLIGAEAERSAVDHAGRWGDSTLLGWSFRGVLEDHAKLDIENKLYDYFVTMHVLAEIANQDKGICDVSR